MPAKKKQKYETVGDIIADRDRLKRELQTAHATALGAVAQVSQWCGRAMRAENKLKVLRTWMTRWDGDAKRYAALPSRMLRSVIAIPVSEFNRARRGKSKPPKEE